MSFTPAEQMAVLRDLMVSFTFYGKSMVCVAHPLQKQSESTAKLFRVSSLAAASPNLYLPTRTKSLSASHDWR